MIIAYLRLHILRLTLLLAFFPFSGSLNAQRINLNSGWTNGSESLWPSKLNDTVVYFMSGNLHDMGMKFCLNLNKIDRLGLYSDEDTCGIDLYKKIELKVVNGIQVLFLKGDYGLFEFFREWYPKEGLSELIEAIKINHELAGKYINPANGKTVTFYPDKLKVSGLTKYSDYTFEEEYDMPADVITFKDNQTFYYEVTEKGLDIFIVKKHDSGDWGKGKKIMSLIKTEWLNTDSLKNTPGRYPFGSKEFLIEGILSCYSTTQLALMRNEIYARHGLIFKSEALKKYFSSQSWYKPQFEKVDDQLSELEKLNIELIRRYEIIQNDNERMWKEAHQN